MKILHIVECAGGVERYLQMLLPRLNEKGIIQFLICSEKYDLCRYQNLVDEVVQMNMQQSFSPFFVLKTSAAIRRQIKKIDPDIIYCHSSFAGGLGRIAAMGLHRKVVYNPHGWAFNIKYDKLLNIKSVVYLVLEKILSQMSDKIVCISESEKRAAECKHIAPSDKLVLILNGIDIDAVRNAVGKHREELGIAEDSFVVGMIGRLSPQKAPDIFIRTAKLIHEEIENSAFIIVGDGDEVEAVENYAKDNDLNLVITGWTNTPYKYLKVFDSAMLLSRWEGFGLAVVEYMAAEKNIVATRIDAIPTLIEDGVDGLLVDVDNPKEAAEKVLWLYHHPKEAVEMANKALKKVTMMYDIDRVVNQHIEMFEEMIRGGVNLREKFNIGICGAAVSKEWRLAA